MLRTTHRNGFSGKENYSISGGGASPCKLLMHFDGADASTTSGDSSIVARGNATFAGNAQLDTAQFKFGTASLLLDGTGDEISYADHADFNIGANDFTIDAWVRWNSLTSPADQRIIGQFDSGTNNRAWLLSVTPNTGRVDLSYSSDGANSNSIASTGNSFSTNTWYHIAATRKVDEWYLFIDGKLKAHQSAFSLTYFNSAASVIIGGGQSQNFNGWIDEVRFVNGFCHWTTDFAVPTGPYTT